MATNIKSFIKEFKGKKIVVLNGFFHRYYLLSELIPFKDELSFEIKDYYEY